MHNQITVKIKKTSAKVPEYKTFGSAGCDVHSQDYGTIMPGETVSVKTGIFLEVPVGYECQVRPRSGLARDYGITVLNSPGTIDSDYRGEICVLLHNTSKYVFEFTPGDRIAQLVFAPVAFADFTYADELSDTERSDKGFGSTGV